MKTAYIGAYEVPDGVYGEVTVAFLCFDPESRKTLEVLPFGWYVSQVYTCVDAQEAYWQIENHPANKRRYRK